MCLNVFKHQDFQIFQQKLSKYVIVQLLPGVARHTFKSVSEQLNKLTLLVKRSKIYSKLAYDMHIGH